MGWVRTTIYSESQRITNWLASGKSVDQFIHTLGVNESSPEMIYDLSNKWYEYVNSYRDDMQYDSEREWYAEHPVNEDNLLAVGKALDDWYWEIRQKQADAEAELAEQ